ncbi:hypothetical protein [Xanthomonas sp. LMG 12462]|uniref:hypothetical protein n=1 Tax=Xanthomonas sp. LMG 12462 TaxID=1591134 RepID=UPI0012652CEF|nr:hypothetical protein [Xanthomonas sp. LMG 12462]
MAFPEESLNQLSQLLERMTRPDDRPRHVPKGSRTKKRTELGFIIAVVVNTVLAIVSIAVDRRYPGILPVQLSYAWLLLPVIPAVGFFAMFFYDMGRMFLEEKRNPWGTIFKQFQTDMLHDAPYIQELKAFPKPMLEYALLQYRHRWSRVDGRAMLLSGDIRKLGLFPGLLAIIVGISKLLENASLPWIWQVASLVGAFQFLAFFVGATGERRAQVIELLEHAIAHAEPMPSESQASVPNQIQPPQAVSKDMCPTVPPVKEQVPA